MLICYKFMLYNSKHYLFTKLTLKGNQKYQGKFTMDQLRTLLLRFKDFNGPAAANIESLSIHFVDAFSNYRLTSGFNTIAYFSSRIYEQLSETTVFGSLAGQLYNELKELEQLLVDSQTQVLGVESFYQILAKIPSTIDELSKELQNPSRKESTFLILLFHFF